MRTTVSIDDRLLAAAKRRARQTGRTLGAVIEDALRRLLASQERGERPVIPVFRGSGVVPGVDLTSNRAIVETLDAGRSLDTLR